MGKEGELFNAKDMALRGRIGGYRTHARHNSEEITRPAREAFIKRFEKKVDEKMELSEEERLMRVRAELKAHMNDLARKSAQRRKRK